MVVLIAFVLIAVRSIFVEVDAVIIIALVVGVPVNVVVIFVVIDSVHPSVIVNTSLSPPLI